MAESILPKIKKYSYGLIIFSKPHPVLFLRFFFIFKQNTNSPPLGFEPAVPTLHEPLSNTAIRCPNENIVFVKMGLPWPLFHLFSYFQTNTTILQPIDMKKCQSSIRCWDSNPQSSKYESPPITTRPGLLPKLTRCFSAVDSIKCFLLRLQKTSDPAFDSRSARFNKVSYNLKVIEPWN